MQPGLEPSKQTLGGDSIPQVARRYLMATRPMFLTASTLAVITGSSWGWASGGTLDLAALLLALLTVACVQAAINVLNDVFDELNGTDRVNVHRIFPYTGGSRFIQNEVLSLEQMRNWAGLLLATAVVLGLVLTAYKGAAVLIFGMAGIALGVFYSAPPLHLASRGLGEFAVAAGFGLLPVTGAAWLQSGILDWPSLLLSIPVSCWVANILVINEVPDAAADAAAGKRTLVVRLGATGTRKLYLGLSLLAFACLVLAVARGWLSAWALALPALLLFISVGNARDIASLGHDLPALKGGIEKTLAIHALGCLWLAGAVWL